MFRLANVDDRAALVHDERWYDLAAVSGDATLGDPMVAVARHAELHAHAAAVAAGDHGSGGAVADVELGPPVPHPSQVFAIGLNYRSHAEESNLTPSEHPVTFTKFPSCLVGPTADIPLTGDQVDWEVELVAVVGRTARGVAAADAWEHVAGLTLGQDVSDREIQLRGMPPQFSLGKSAAAFGPIGPAVVSLDAFDDPGDVGLWCDVSGERMQASRTSDLIADVPALVAYLSSICTLRPGDLIFTGTPGGVGMGRGRYLRVGDVVESGAEVIGTLRNVCVGGGAG